MTSYDTVMNLFRNKISNLDKYSKSLSVILFNNVPFVIIYKCPCGSISKNFLHKSIN